MNPSKNAVPYLAASVLCFASVIWILSVFFAAGPKPAAAVSIDISSEYDVSDLADSALNVTIAAPSGGFSTGSSSPFRHFGSGARAAAGSAGSAAKTPAALKHPRLNLKGLMKNPPLAILEDTRGETHIKAQGDYIQSAQLIAIEDNAVLLKDSSGTYKLTVEENR